MMAMMTALALAEIASQVAAPSVAHFHFLETQSHALKKEMVQSE